MDRTRNGQCFSKTILNCFFALIILIPLPMTAIALEAPIIKGRSKMAPGEKQVLSIMNYQTGSTYAWSISGVGTLSSDTGKSVTYEAPATNPNCNNPTISVLLNGALQGTLEITINASSSGAIAYGVLSECLYQNREDLLNKLIKALESPKSFRAVTAELSRKTRRFDWKRVAPLYDECFERLVVS